MVWVVRAPALATGRRSEVVPRKAIPFRPRADMSARGRKGIFITEAQWLSKSATSPSENEPRLQARWQEQGTYHFAAGDDPRPVYSIDTPPPTVSGLSAYRPCIILTARPISSPVSGGCAGTTFITRWVLMTTACRPSDWSRNSLECAPERWSVADFIEHCLRISEEMEQDYRSLWQRLGLSVDWRYTYRTIDEHSRRCCAAFFPRPVSERPGLPAPRPRPSGARNAGLPLPRPTWKTASARASL